jgi:tritrans,polycis-undecaprenyl-diphosphate synthase [geranylgeranyl-diphosphate specific]
MIPNHVAVIPDGNRRWAKKHRKTIVQGYLAGIDKVGEVLQWGRELEVRQLTFWGLSTENLSRNERELKTLMRLFELKFREAIERNEFHEHGIRFRVFGDRNLLPGHVRSYIDSLEETTRDYSNYFVNVLLGYGGRQEIINACNAVLRDYETGKLKKVDERNLPNYLYTGKLDDPELIIRTSGERRLSGFLPWQSAYSEFYFSERLWPDFDRRELEEAVNDYGSRKRRFGR